MSVTPAKEQGFQVTLMDWGATWLSCQVPLQAGGTREVLLGCPTPMDYLRQNAYLGATVGRYANRIRQATLNHDGQRFALVANQGYPGNLVADVRYTVTDDNARQIDYHATVDKPCPVNLTNHGYFHLDGANSDIRQQRLQIIANDYLPVDGEGIPCADPTDVGNTGMDFRQPKTIAADFLRDRDQQRMKGYDHGYLLYPGLSSAEDPAARLWSADGQVQMEMYTTAPAIQFYTGNFLAGPPGR